MPITDDLELPIGYVKAEQAKSLQLVNILDLLVL